jgi:hypothetical protein
MAMKENTFIVLIVALSGVRDFDACSKNLERFGASPFGAKVEAAMQY